MSAGLLRSDKRKKITGVSYTTDKRAYEFFDEERKQLQAFLEAKLPGVEVGLSDSSKDETKFLVRTYSDRTLGAYYYFDLEGKKADQAGGSEPVAECG